jgi:hypothetical protein
MMTGVNPEVAAAARRLAAGLLGVPENASSREARRAYFQKLRECDFLPPRSWQQALQVLEGNLIPAGPNAEWLFEQEGRLHAEVVVFAEAFFAFPVMVRRDRWEDLLSRCQGMLPLTARLQALKAGLEVENATLPVDSSPRGQLAGHLLQSFSLPPLARAASRQAFLRKIEEPSAAADRKAWERAARDCQAEWPAVAALDQELVQYLAKLRRRLGRRNKTHQRSQRQRQTALAGNRQASPWWFLLIVVGVVSGILRSATSSNTPPTFRSPSPSYSLPPRDLRLKEPENLRGRMVTDPETGAKSFQVVPFNVPPIQELLDPSRYDVTLLSPSGPRVLVFTLRTDSTPDGPGGPQANRGKPIFLGEATLRLIGASREQMDGLFSRATGKKPPDNTLKPPPDEVGPPPARGSQGDESRP